MYIAHNFCNELNNRIFLVSEHKLISLKGSLVFTFLRNLGNLEHKNYYIDFHFASNLTLENYILLNYKKVSKKEVFSSKFGCFLMIPYEFIKCPIFFNKPAFLKLFNKSTLPKSPFFSVKKRKEYQISSDPYFRNLGLF